MRTADVVVTKHGADWIAHRPDEWGHECADGVGAHGVADTVTGAVRRLIRAEEASDG